jgi:1,2-phenylacetyl-CoA epoxidase catalytic subunit
MDTLTTLIEARELAAAKLKIHELRSDTLRTAYEKAINKLQEACPHDDTEKTSKYYSGGYDYVDETIHKLTCKICNRLVETWSTSMNMHG